MSYILEQKDAPFVARNGFKRLSPTPHIHRHIELVYLMEGAGTATADNRSGRLEPGDVYLSFPNQVHYFEKIPAKGYIFIVSPDLFPALKDIFLHKIPVYPIIKKERLPSDMTQRLATIFHCANAADELQHAAANGYMQALLAQVLALMELVDINTEHDSVKRILRFCSEHYMEPITLELLAKELYLSKDYISHVFSDRLGIHFPDFVNELRIEQACRKLIRGCTMTEVAYASGFGSIRSFNRNFKRRMGVSPSEFMKAEKIM